MPSRRNIRLNVSQLERNFILQYLVFSIRTMRRKLMVNLTAENSDEIEINFDFFRRVLPKICWGLSHTNLLVGIEYEIMEHKICDYHCIAAMCEDKNSGWKRGTMGSTRYDHKEAASSYHVSSSVCLHQRKLSTIFFPTKPFILLLISYNFFRQSHLYCCQYH